MYRLLRSCRACGSAELTSVFNLGIQPLANDFCDALDEHAGYAPLEGLYCNQCSLAQLSVVVNPDVMFSKYSYVTSPSATMQRHFDVLYKDIIGQQGSLGDVLEIGSNDGRFLRFLKDRGAKAILGVDPATNLAAEANVSGIPTLEKAFNIATAEQVKTIMPTPHVIIARHVFCHVPNWRDFMAALQIVSGPKTLILIEVPHAEKMLRNVEFDTVYHEHSSYLTIKSVKALLAGTTLGISQVGTYPIHGGTIGLYLRREAKDCGVMDNVTLEDWRQFSLRATQQIEELSAAVRARVLHSYKVCGFGASAKATVWINACRFTKKEIAFVTDTTALKIGKTVPGTDIPIVDESELLARKPDYAVMFCWNYALEVYQKQKAFLDGGGKFIVPIPKLAIVGKENVST